MSENSETYKSGSWSNGEKGNQVNLTQNLIYESYFCNALIMGRNGYGSNLSWAEMVADRNDQRPFRSSAKGTQPLKALTCDNYGAVQEYCAF